MKRKHSNPDCQCAVCKNMRGEYKGKTAPNYIDGRSSKKYSCIDCGDKITYQTWNYGNKRCTICANKGINNPFFKDGRCSNKYFCKCGNEIDFSTFFYKSGLCHSCAMKKFYSLFPDAKKGSNNSNWQNGIGKLPYSFDFTLKLKDSIRKRDNYICQKCNITEEEHLIVYGKVLSIHHIDYNKQNCKEDNLITLCISCNFRANYNRDYWQKFYTDKILEKTLLEV